VSFKKREKEKKENITGTAAHQLRGFNSVSGG